jgi:hypothetical protein
MVILSSGNHDYIYTMSYSSRQDQLDDVARVDLVGHLIKMEEIVSQPEYVGTIQLSEKHSAADIRDTPKRVLIRYIIQMERAIGIEGNKCKKCERTTNGIYCSNCSSCWNCLAHISDVPLNNRLCYKCYCEIYGEAHDGCCSSKYYHNMECSCQSRHRGNSGFLPTYI